MKRCKSAANVTHSNGNRKEAAESISSFIGEQPSSYYKQRVFKPAYNFVIDKRVKKREFVAHTALEVMLSTLLVCLSVSLSICPSRGQEPIDQNLVAISVLIRM